MDIHNMDIQSMDFQNRRRLSLQIEQQNPESSQKQQLQLHQQQQQQQPFIKSFKYQKRFPTQKECYWHLRMIKRAHLISLCFYYSSFYPLCF